MSTTTEISPSAPSTRPPHYGLVLGVTTLLSVLLFWLLWQQDIKERIFPRNFDAVIPGEIYRSGRLSAAVAERTFRDNNISAVVCLIPDSDAPQNAKPMNDAIAKLGIDRVVFPMDGNGVSTPERYADAVAAITKARKAGKAVLVHCNAGAQRTGGVIATYQLLVQKLPPEQVRAHLYSHGHHPSDNTKLLPWFNDALPQIAKELVARGVIDQVPDPLPTLK